MGVVRSHPTSTHHYTTTCLISVDLIATFLTAGTSINSPTRRTPTGYQQQGLGVWINGKGSLNHKIQIIGSQKQLTPMDQRGMMIVLLSSKKYLKNVHQH